MIFLKANPHPSFANPCYLLKDPLSTLPLKLPSSVPMSALLRALITSQFFFSIWVAFFCSKFESFRRPFSKLFPFLLWACRIFENEFFKQDWRSRGVVQIFQYICMKWLLCLMIGVIVGFIGFCNNLAVENLAGIKFVITSNMMLQRRYCRFVLCSFDIFNLIIFFYVIVTFLIWYG